MISMYLFPGSAKIFNEDRDDLQRTFVWEAFIFSLKEGRIEHETTKSIHVSVRFVFFSISLEC